MIRNTRRPALRELAVFYLTYCLIFSQLAAAFPVTANAAPAKNKLRSASSNTADLPIPPADYPHKQGEMLVKFRASTIPAEREQFLSMFSNEHNALRGQRDTERIKLKDGLDVPAALVNARQLTKIVEWAEPNYTVTSAKAEIRIKKTATLRQAVAANHPRYRLPWSLANAGQANGLPGADIGALAGWEKTKGARNTVIAVIDTGVDTRHPDLVQNLWINQAERRGQRSEDDDRNHYMDDVQGWNFINESNDVADDNGHGTAMAGIIAAEANNHIGIAGVMWQASVMPLKALNATGSGSISDVVEAIDYARANSASVINCSFGTHAFSQALQEAIQRAGNPAFWWSPRRATTHRTSHKRLITPPDITPTIW